MSIPTDLASLVSAITDARDELGMPPMRKPWLEPLPEAVTLDDVLGDFPAATPSADRLVLPFGLVDVPAEQRRDVATFNLEGGGHLGIVGAPRAGRSTALRALAGVVGRFTSPADVHLYGVDCGNNALLPLVGLPHVGAVVTRDQTDRMDRLVSRLRQLISQRQQDLAVAGFADVTEQRKHVQGPDRMSYVVVLFDRWEGFFAAYDALDSGRLVQAWQQIMQEGAAVGIRIVMTGDRTLLIGRMSTLFDDKLLLRMVDPQRLHHDRDALPPDPVHRRGRTRVPGRGYRARPRWPCSPTTGSAPPRWPRCRPSAGRRPGATPTYPGNSGRSDSTCCRSGSGSRRHSLPRASL